jgi:hypothetical protein
MTSKTITARMISKATVPRVMSCPSRDGTISHHYELQVTTCLHSNHRAVDECSIAGFAIWKKDSAAASAGLQTRNGHRR